mmetsp:Transcript_15596/g.25631  ORF Transcript_15596/g.25631 Transcript_15596/m.25631 type:complete len:80 (+) Transcript_15596:220-459(+)
MFLSNILYMKSSQRRSSMYSGTSNTNLQATSKALCLTLEARILLGYTNLPWMTQAEGTLLHSVSIMHKKTNFCSRAANR